MNSEQRFRRWTRSQDHRLMSLLVTILTVAAASFAVLDLIYYADGLKNGPVLAIRASVLVVSAVVLFLLRRPASPRVFDWTVALWLASVLLMQLGVAMLRPVGWSPVSIINMLLVLGAYTLLPVPTAFKAVPALCFSAANLVMLVVAGIAGTAATGRVEIATVAAYLVANVLGMIVSRRHERLRRRQFLVLERERESRRRLRAALDEVKVLRGIVPICSFCKKVRNDDGLYEAVEAYLRRHSEADFSHTLCPDCLQEQYPQVLTP